MPKCLNQEDRYYTGKEPSPKGLGYCASGEKEGTKMKGKDGKMWIKKKGKWVKYDMCTDFVTYEVTIAKTKTRRRFYLLNGLKSGKRGFIYKHIGYNQFEEELTKIPKNAKIRRRNKKWIEDYKCGSKTAASLIKAPKDNIHKGCKKYFTHDNGGRPFLVCIKDKTDVLIYKVPSSTYRDNGIKDYHYSELVKKYKPEKIFIAKGYDGNDVYYHKRLKHDKFFEGNSILLQLSKHKYVFIGESIYEFKTKDEIAKYYSVVGNNDVPYPVAIGTEYIYFMLDRTAVPDKYFPKKDFKEYQLADAYGYYYGHQGPEALSKYAKKMTGVKTIQKREW